MEHQWNMLVKEIDQFTYSYTNVVSETASLLPRLTERDGSYYKCVMLLQQVYDNGCNLDIVVLWSQRLT